jgi:hypothetical protein
LFIFARAVCARYLHIVWWTGSRPARALGDTIQAGIISKACDD